MNHGWQGIAVTLANLVKTDGTKYSWREIAEIVEKPKSTVSDFLRKTFTEENLKVEKKPDPVLVSKQVEVRIKGKYVDQYELDFEDNSRILFISDMHAPYHHPDTLQFLKNLKAKYNPTRVVLLGDEVDYHALSFHDSDPDLDSAGPELEKAKEFIRQVKELFPIADVVDSNHGSLGYRKAKHHGIPRSLIKSYNEVLGIDDGWKWHHDLTITLPNGQSLYVHHGKNADALKVAQTMGQNFICGHHHERFAIQYYSTPGNLLWGVNSGCLIDRKSLAFAYNNNNLKRPVIGTSLVIDSHPILEAMPL
jgi:predicted phosphodiesterase